MSRINHYISKQEARRGRVRSKISGTASRPRLTIKRANKHIYLQVIDDVAGKTLLSVDDVKIRKAVKKGEELNKTEAGILATKELVTLMKKAKIVNVVFDRGQYKYHGRVKAVAETLRSKGIKV